MKDINFKKGISWVAGSLIFGFFVYFNSDFFPEQLRIYLPGVVMFLGIYCLNKAYSLTEGFSEKEKR